MVISSRLDELGVAFYNQSHQQEDLFVEVDCHAYGFIFLMNAKY
ncbi:hypothetical protein OEV75_12395 [Caldibacillus kokeshiiformis]|jgi:hypothetical protein|nr:hypothetical protein [Pallidibacillus thermolactis subsp. kokeshiiformis]